jgi:hypothetical protein
MENAMAAVKSHLPYVKSTWQFCGGYRRMFKKAEKSENVFLAL